MIGFYVCVLVVVVLIEGLCILNKFYLPSLTLLILLLFTVFGILFPSCDKLLSRWILITFIIFIYTFTFCNVCILNKSRC